MSESSAIPTPNPTPLQVRHSVSQCILGNHTTTCQAIEQGALLSPTPSINETSLFTDGLTNILLREHASPSFADELAAFTNPLHEQALAAPLDAQNTLPAWTIAGAVFCLVHTTVLPWCPCVCLTSHTFLQTPPR